MTNRIEAHLRQYAITEAIFRGTALLSNLLATALIAMSPGFGTLGILGSTLIQVLVAAALEIPSGWFADRFGWKTSIFIGLSLKFGVTLTFAGAIFSAHSDRTDLAWGLLVIEAILDSFASSFLSGSFEAAYESWFVQKIGKETFQEKRPLIFLDSFKYGLKTRLSIPIAGILLSGALILRNSAESVLYLSQTDAITILVSILFFRFLVILRTHRDLKDLATEVRPIRSIKTESSKTTLRQNLLQTAPELMSYALGGFLYVAVSMYMVGEAFYILRDLTAGNLSFTWYIGQSLGLSVNLIVIIASRLFFPKLSGNVSQKALGVIYLATALVFAMCALVVVLQGSSWLSFLALTIYSILGILAGNYLQRKVSSQLTPLVPAHMRATWLSIGQALGYILFGLHGTILLFAQNRLIGPLVMILSSALFCGLLAISHLLKSGRSGSLPSIRRYFTVLSLFSVFFVATTIGTWDSLRRTENSRQILASLQKELVESLKNEVHEPLLLGTITAVRSRIEKFVSLHPESEIELNTSIFSDKETNIKNSGIRWKSRSAQHGINEFKEVLRFSNEDPQNTLGSLTIRFDISSIETEGRIDLAITLGTYLLIGFLVFLVIFLVSHSFQKEFESIAADSANHEANWATSLNGTRSFVFSESAAIQEALTRYGNRVSKLRADAEIGSIATQVAHDIRAPIAALRVALQAIKDDDSEVAELIRNATFRIQSIAEDLLRKKRSRNQTTTTLLNALNVLVLESEQQAKLAGVNVLLNADPASGVALAHCPEAVLSRALSSLITNAIEASEGSDDARVVVGLSEELCYWCVSIRDFGKGFDPEVIKRLGQPGNTMGKQNGNGLGLHYAFELAHQYGFSISVTTRPELEIGSIISIRFPVNPTQSRHEEDTGKTVLTALA